MAAVVEQGHLFTKYLQKIKAQLPTITEKDIITTLNLIHMCCSSDESIIVVVSNIAEYYKKQDEKFDDELFIKNINYALQFIDQDLMSSMRILISHISIYNVFNYPLLWSDFNQFIKNNSMINVAFLEEKIKVMKSNNVSFDEKIKSCHDLNKLNTLKKQLDNNLDIFKHFKLVCEDSQLCVLNCYNFIANRIKYSFANNNTDNGIVLVASEYAKIQKIITRENRFNKILIIVKSSNSQLSYKLNIKALILIFKQEMVNLLYEYQLETFLFKKKSSSTNLKIKALRLKIQNIFDLSKIIFDIFEQSFQLLPLTKVTNDIFDESDSKDRLKEVIKEIDNNIKILEESNEKLNKKSNEKSNKKMQEILVEDVKKEPLAKRKAKKKSKKNKKNNNLELSKLNETDNLAFSTVASMQVNKATICKINEFEEVKKLENDIFDINVAAEVITENNVKVITTEKFKEDELKLKINELEKQLKQMEEKLKQTKVKSTTKAAILEQQLKTENDNKIKLEAEVKNDKLTITKLQAELKNVHSKENKRRKENKKSSQQLKKINEQLVKEKQALKRSKSENQQLLSEVNKLKKNKAELEKAEQENNNQIKVKEESIALLEKQLATINIKQTAEVAKLVKQKEILIFGKQKLESINKVNKKQLMNLLRQLEEKQELLSQCNPNLNAFADNYYIKPCVKVEPVFEQQMVPKTVIVDVVQPVVASVPILVSTGNKIVVETISLENMYAGDKLTTGFYLQSKLSNM